MTLSVCTFREIVILSISELRSSISWRWLG